MKVFEIVNKNAGFTIHLLMSDGYNERRVKVIHPPDEHSADLL